ncbi:hypothetical protein M0802_013981 [Mischocyttarus mexicanus]|nr:hypothetical protein M0802_013981 [Mischocyttarus mexicanus]
MAVVDNKFVIFWTIILLIKSINVISYAYSYTTSDSVNNVTSIIANNAINGNTTYKNNYLKKGTNFNISNLMDNTTYVEELFQMEITEEDYIKYCVTKGNCLSFCCPPDFYYISKNKCERIVNRSIPLPKVYTIDLLPMNYTTNDQNFRFLYWNPCKGDRKYPLNPEAYPDEKFFLLRNGSFYLPYLENGNKMLNPRQYCLTIMKHLPNEYLLLFCKKNIDKDTSIDFYIESSVHGFLISLGMIISIPFLIITWLVYTFIKELRNLHGFVLRAYIASLTLSYVILTTVQIVPSEWISNTCCVFLAFCMYFFFLASFYWLNVMCFDIWWTFGFNLYVKLFIVMGITWITEIMSTLSKGSPDFIWYITDMVNTLQGLIIFVTLVCKEKIKRLLLKKLGYKNSKFFSRSFTRSFYNSSASRTTCTTSGLPLQEKVDANIRREAFRSSKESTEDKHHYESISHSIN